MLPGLRTRPAFRLERESDQAAQHPGDLGDSTTVIPTADQVVELVEAYLRETTSQAWARCHPLESVRELHLTRSGATAIAKESRRPMASRPLAKPLRGAPLLADRMLRELEVLNARYRQVLELRACGLTHQELAKAMKLSKSTVAILLEGATAAGRMWLTRA